MRPWGSTPPATGEICGRPSVRVVASSIRCLARTKASISVRSTTVVVAMSLAMIQGYGGADARHECSDRVPRPQLAMLQR